MGGTLLFARLQKSPVTYVSPQHIALIYLLIREQLVEDLQHTVIEAGHLRVSAEFIPAMRSALEPHKPGENEIPYHADVFEDATDQQLYELHDERQHDRNWIESGLFAVLDSRSVDDRTTVIYNDYVEYRDYDGPPEEIDWRWVKWRVSFADAWILIAHLCVTTAIVEEVYMQSDRFTGEDGVFNVQEALRQTGYLGKQARSSTQ